jgi:hypothetical protein|tara:strand:+ start:528 stop:956 length:429 start_codon:yes stop_codon:yes gene_type:complete
LVQILNKQKQKIKVMKMQKSYVTPKWIKIKGIYKANTNGSDKYGTNFPIKGELDNMSMEFVEMLGVLTRKFGWDYIIEDVSLDLWKERIWSLIENAGLLQDIAWKLEKEDEVEDSFYKDEDEFEMEDREPTLEELNNLNLAI